MLAVLPFIMPKQIFSAALLLLTLCPLVRPQGCSAQDSASPSTEASAQTPAPSESVDPPAEEISEIPTMFPHSQTAPWWVSGQFNTILQAHPTFYSPYSGPNSFQPAADHATSYVDTLYLGYLLEHGTELLLDMESTGGNGLSTALGLAGFTNLDVVRNPSSAGRPTLRAWKFIRRFVSRRKTWCRSRPSLAGHQRSRAPAGVPLR